jgi:acylphosphatase
MKRVELVVSGIVQGVGFRYFCQKQAENLGITGSVMNLPEGTVRVEAQGEEEPLQAFIDLVRKGPRSSIVLSMSEKELPLKQDESSLVVDREF